MENTDEKVVSAEKIIHAELRNVLQDFYKKYDICVLSANFDWLNVSMGNMIVTNVKIETISRRDE